MNTHDKKEFYNYLLSKLDGENRHHIKDSNTKEIIKKFDEFESLGFERKLEFIENQIDSWNTFDVNLYEYYMKYLILTCREMHVVIMGEFSVYKGEFYCDCYSKIEEK